MRRFDTSVDTPESIRDALIPPTAAESESTETTVRQILADVRKRGDQAVADYTRRFDWPDATADRLEIPRESLSDSASANDPRLAETLSLAAQNIRLFHEAERGALQSWMRPGTPSAPTWTGQIIRPVRRAGIYVPGGKAAYPSTVLMAAIPARVAGVEEIILCTPPGPDGQIPDLVAHAAYGHVDRVFRIGGAQAVAAMAYGTESVPKVDVIAGPGNRFVNVAKRQVYGDVGIDMLAGPSEVAILADDTANPAYVAADLLAQTEHGPDNRGVVFALSRAILDKIAAEAVSQRETLTRREILDQSAAHLVFILAHSLDDAFFWINEMAPEHLELHVAEPMDALARVENAGAVLIGGATSASVGDYFAGPSHTLPTAGAARFSSPLSVNTFMKRTNVLSYSAKAASDSAETIARFAEAEGFDAHARAARLRKESA